MCNYVLFWISYLLSALQRIWILKRFFCGRWSRAWKTRSKSREINNPPPYVENNYRIEVKITFMLIAYLVLLCKFFWEFSSFHFCRPLVDIYWHPLLRHFKLIRFPYLRATRGASNPNLKVVITHASHVCCQNSFGLPLGMYGMHRTHFDHVRLDLLSLVIWSRVFWPYVTWNVRETQRQSKSVLTFHRCRPHTTFGYY